MEVSIVVPIHNEEENLVKLAEQIRQALGPLEQPYEVILVDDGSRDGSVPLIRKMIESDPHLRLVQLRRNYGQTAAMQAGIEHASGDVIVTLDGDLQNDPADIPMMLSHIADGFDLVHGWRKDRKDALVSRKLPSRIANWIISRTTGFPIHDLGCTLKAIRRDIASELHLYGEMHRFIPIIAYQRGARCKEVVTNHRPRIHGTTKYGIDRTFRVVLDLITVWYMLRFFASPMKLFGGVGLLTAAVGISSLMLACGMKLLGGWDITGNPLFLLSAISSLASIQFFSLGLLGEVCSRIYFKTTELEHHTVRELVGFQRSTIPFSSAAKQRHVA